MTYSKYSPVHRQSSGHTGPPARAKAPHGRPLNAIGYAIKSTGKNTHAQPEKLKRVQQDSEHAVVHGDPARHDNNASPEPSYPSVQQQRKHIYEDTLSRIRTGLPAPLRPLSKIIHQPAIEKLSDALSATIARPSAILAGSVTAFVFVSGTYLMALYNGFSLSGSETFIAFAAGWIAGIIFDLTLTLFRRNR